MNEQNSRPAEFVMASLLTGYPGPEFEAQVRQVIEDIPSPDARVAAAWEVITRPPVDCDELRSHYIDTFDRGRDSNPLYETEYGRNRALSKGAELVDIAGFYKAFGLEIGAADGGPEMHDHVSVELEFYALMLMKQEALEAKGDSAGVEIVRDGRKKFLLDHLGRFVSAIPDRPGVKASPIYGPIFSWCSDLIARECEALGIEPVKIDYLGQALRTDARPDEDVVMACGGTACADGELK